MSMRLAAALAVSLAITMSSAWAQGVVECPVAPSVGTACPNQPGGSDDAPVLVAQENLWFSEPRLGGINYLLDGHRILPFEPLLGLTSSANELVKLQEMQWFFRYTGQTSSNSVFSVEWFAPRDLIDRNLRKTFLPLIEQTDSRWNIFYDPVLASVWRGHGPGPVDFSRPVIRRMFESDIEFLREKYFDHPNYWRIDGKPVLHVWAARQLVENGADVFQSLRDRGVYICGDVFGQKGDEPPLDCRTGFTAATPDVVAQGRFQTVQQVLPNFERYFQSSSDGTDMIPAFSFQYDDVEFRTRLGTGGTAIQILAHGRHDLRDWLELADRYSEPIDGARYIWVGTLNGWAEATTIYPTERGRQEFFRQGESRGVEPYHFAILEVIQRQLYPDSPYTGPRIEKLEDGAILFRNCDLFAGFRIKVTSEGRTLSYDLDPPEDVELLPNLDWVWRPEFPFDKISVRVKNLDGKRTKKIIRRPRAGRAPARR